MFLLTVSYAVQMRRTENTIFMEVRKSSSAVKVAVRKIVRKCGIVDKVNVYEIKYLEENKDSSF